MPVSLKVRLADRHPADSRLLFSDPFSLHSFTSGLDTIIEHGYKKDFLFNHRFTTWKKSGIGRAKKYSEYSLAPDGE